MTATREYFPTPTLKKFHADNSFVRGVRGPIGSGKSVACCMEIIARAARQKPDAKNVRKSRWAIIRNTYPELKSTTIKTWQEWISDSVCPIVYDSPIRGRMTKKLPDQTIIDLEIYFISLDKQQDLDKLMSLELTGGWINEARFIEKSILDALTGRVGRYPAKIDGGCSWSGVIMDTNPPDDMHWWYRLAEEELPKGWKFYSQPGAIIYDEKNACWIGNDHAENLHNHTHGLDYYMRQVPGKSREWINVFLCGNYGSSMDGKLVFPEYNDDIHSIEEIPIFENQPLLVAFDFGLTPACVIGQVSPRGRLVILDEIVTENMGIKQFCEDLLIPKISSYPKMKYQFTGDPAGNSRAQTDETTCFEIIRSFGFDAEPASTNSFLARREAVANYLIRLSDGKPCFYLSHKAKFLRKGFLGGYRYKRIQVAGEAKFKDEPEKNQYSHVHDALQYLSLLAAGGNFSKEAQAERENKMKKWPTQERGAM